MDEIPPAPQPRIKPESILEPIVDVKNMEAHIIADMLRIEALTTELREFKNDTKKRFDKIESWLIGIVATTVTTLIATLGSVIFKLIG